MKRALFLDRDGTVCREVGYVNHPSRLELLPRSAAAIRRARQAGFLCVLVTNQAGVARGYFTEDLVHLAHARLEELLAAAGTALDGIYYCPHHPTAGKPPYQADCDCRKPRPGMLHAAARDLEIDISRSYVVGDKISDVEMAHGQHAHGILVRTGYGRGEEEYSRDSWTTQPAAITDDLLDAVDWILAAGAAPREPSA
jgi:D-glycero-D-manno-heptose 1,7-bisphosphate phosphatase